MISGVTSRNCDLKIFSEQVQFLLSQFTESSLEQPASQPSNQDMSLRFQWALSGGSGEYGVGVVSCADEECLNSPTENIYHVKSYHDFN